MKNTNPPFFTIAIPTKDRQDLLSDLIGSVLNQSYQNFEIIISDNSVNNKTQKIINNFKDDRIVNIKTGNLKMSDNWNKATEKASGQYLLVISDKAVLKQGSLKYLYELIQDKKYMCITWGLDQYIDSEDRYISTPSDDKVFFVKSKKLFQSILSSDWIGFDLSPMHCNSCVSLDVIKSSRKKLGSLSFELNPDYTMAAQILLNLDGICRVGKNLAVLRRPTLAESYGNGSSFLKKTTLSQDFMKEHANWIEKTDKAQYLPIKGNPFVLDIMLKDIYMILESYDVDPDVYIGHDDRLVLYYIETYKELLWRIKMGIDMKVEQSMWKHAFDKESVEITTKVNKELLKLKRKSVESNIYFFIKNNSILRKLLPLIRKVKYRKLGYKYSSINSCLESHHIV